jgi:hypothetical protein
MIRVIIGRNEDGCLCAYETENGARDRCIPRKNTPLAFLGQYEVRCPKPSPGLVVLRNDIRVILLG